MLPLLFVVSGVGFAVNGLAHVSTYFGLNPRMEFLGIWAILAGCIVFWGQPARITNRLIEDGKSGDFWTAVVKNQPLWLKALFGLMILYVIITFIYWSSFTTGIEYIPKLVSGYNTVFYLITGVLFLLHLRNPSE